MMAVSPVLSEDNLDLFSDENFLIRNEAVQKVKSDILPEIQATEGQAALLELKEAKVKEKREAIDSPLEEIFDVREVSSVKKFEKTKLNRDRSFKLPDSKIPVRKKKRLRLQDVQPPSSSQTYYSSGTDEAELEKATNEEIDYLFKLLKKNRNAELTLRLGALYVEKARLISFKIQMDYDQKMEAFKAGQRKTKPFLNLKPAQLYNGKSLKLFKDFKASYPKHKRMDEVLFFLGFNFYQLANEKEGIKHFSELEARFPKSSYLYEARFQLGEHYFKMRKWKESFKYYKKVAKNKRGKFYFFALYKMAWSAYKMDKTLQGLALLEKIIKEGKAFQVVSDRNQTFVFTEEAIQDLVLFYTYSNKPPEQAKSFFLNLLDREKAWTLLTKLAYAYRDTGKTRGVLVLFDELIKQDPAGEEAFQYYHQIVESSYNFGKTSEIIKKLETWVRSYGPGSNWARVNRGNPSLLQKAFKLQEVTVRNYSLKNHEHFRKTRNKREKRLALSFYKIYFDYYTRSPFLDQMNFFYGELLFDSRKYISAVKSYEKVISEFPQSKYVKASYVNQLLALEKILPGEVQLQKLAGKAEQPIDLPGSVQGFMKVAARYVQKFPREKNVPNILYRMAALYYKFNQFSLAAKYFKKLSEEHPTSKLVSNVGGILLDIYNKNKDYKSLEELALQLMQNKNIKPELLREVRSILEQISFTKAQNLAVNKKYRESAVLYEKFARENTGSPLAPSAFYNAGLNYEKEGDRLKALSMYSAVLAYKGQAHRKIRKKSQEFLAVLYEKLGFYKTAAKAYVSFAKSYPSDSKAIDFWYNAGVIFDALGDIGSAVYSYKQYLTLSKKSDRHEVFYLIAFMYEKKRRWKKAIENYNQYLKSPASNKARVVRASSLVAEIYEKKLRNPAQAGIWHQKTLSLYRRLKVGLSYAARSHFYITKSLYDDFSKVKIPASPKQQAQAVQKKLKLLNTLERALKPVIRYNDGEQILASLALIGKANQEMAKAIYKAPTPRALNKQGLIQYKEGIKKLIQPYITEALKSYNLVLKKSFELKVYSEWLGTAYNGLSEIQMKNGAFEKFLPRTINQKALPLQVIDSTGAVTESFLKSVTKSFEYGVSREDFANLARAMATKKESSVLEVVSKILNKDPNNVPAINSLALFYIKNNKPSLGALVLGRVSSKKASDPVIMNNLAVLSLKYGDVREAMQYLKKALEKDSSHAIARVNLATLFTGLTDYRNAYFYYKNSYQKILKRWSPRNQKHTHLLNNYAVTLTHVGKWKEASSIFHRLVRSSSPQAEILLNYALFLTEKSKREPVSLAKGTLTKAREVIDELTLYSGSSGLKNRVRRLLVLVDRRLRELKNSSQKKKVKRTKR